MKLLCLNDSSATALNYSCSWLFGPARVLTETHSNHRPEAETLCSKP